MRKRRVVLAGLLAGSVSFAWGIVSHVLLDSVHASIQALPDEPAVLAALERSLPGAGFYLYPVGARDADPEKNAAAQSRLPHGIVVYTPPGEPASVLREFSVQLAGDLACGWIAAVLLSVAAPSLPGFPARVLFVLLLGAFAILAVDLPYWNWYGFPTEYLLGRLFDSLMGWGLAGAALARLLRPADVA